MVIDLAISGEVPIEVFLCERMSLRDVFFVRNLRDSNFYTMVFLRNFFFLIFILLFFPEKLNVSCLLS